MAKCYNYGELEKESDVVQSIEKLHQNQENIKRTLDVYLENDVYDKLDTTDQIRHDLFTSYSLCTLYWMYLKTNGIEPSTVLKAELQRIQEYMSRLKILTESHLRPKLALPVAKRFVKNSLYENDIPVRHQNKKMKFDK